MTRARLPRLGTKSLQVLFGDAGEEDETGLAAGHQIVFEDVLMFGTADLTVLGRPTLSRARVYATIEEMTLSEKVIIFKKKRRQGYQKSRGHK